jgi:uncharacterized protein (DUF2147 family)
MLQCPRKLARTTFYSAVLMLTGVAPALALDPTGDWRVAEGVANIRVAECNGSMWGAVSWEQTPGGRDTQNPDVSKQNRPTLGMPILIDLKKKPSVDQWEGQVYNAKDGQHYGVTIKPLDPNRLEIRGCLLGFLCSGETWTRVAGPIPSSPANSMAKSSPKSTGALPKSVTATSTTGAPKTTGSINPPAKGQKQATTPSADPVGDICLLPEISGFTH